MIKILALRRKQTTSVYRQDLASIYQLESNIRAVPICDYFTNLKQYGLQTNILHDFHIFIYKT